MADGTEKRAEDLEILYLNVLKRYLIFNIKPSLYYSCIIWNSRELNE